MRITKGHLERLVMLSLLTEFKKPKGRISASLRDNVIYM